MNELVDRLSKGKHPIEVSIRPERTASELKGRIEDGYVHIKFTATRGGTELGVTLEKEKCDLSESDFERGEGHIKLAGRLKLNYVPVRCIADIDLATFSGTGYLEVLQEVVPHAQ